MKSRSCGSAGPAPHSSNRPIQQTAHGAARWLQLQRQAGNRAARALLSAPVVQRQFVDDIADSSVEGAITLLRQRFPDRSGEINYKSVAPYSRSATAYNLAALATALGLSGHAAAKRLPSFVDAKAVPSSQQVTARPPARKPPGASRKNGTEEAKHPKSKSDTPVTTPERGNPTGTQTEFDLDGLRTHIAALYKRSKSPTKQDFMTAFKSEYHPDHIATILGSKDFVYGFQSLIREQQEGRLSDEDPLLESTKITEVGEEKPLTNYKMYEIGRWTLRHYSTLGDDTTPPPFSEIKSAVQLGLLAQAGEKGGKEKKSGHTGDRDWNKYGNTGSTFFLLYLDGEPVEKQKFLDNTKWYAEVPFGQPSLWISSDWLDEKGVKGPALRGSGKDVQQKLLRLGGLSDGAIFRNTLAGKFHNLEVKIPGAVPVKEWKKA